MIRCHLDKTIKKRNISLCKPSFGWEERYKAVVAGLTSRLQHHMALKATKPSASTRSSEASAPLVDMRPTAGMVTEQWARAIAKKGLSLDLVDDPDFRAAVLITARAGQNYVDALKGTTKLPWRRQLTSDVLPALDAKLDAKMSKKIDGLIKETGAMLISDGWTSISMRPIINGLLATAAGTRFLKAVDTSNEIKDAAFIANFVITMIEEAGPENIVAVCMDGACKASFSLIIDKFEHVFCFICPTHSIDNFLKNVCSDKPRIKVKDIVDDFEWGRDIFYKPIVQAWEVIKFITHHAKPLATFRAIAADAQVWKDADKQQPAFVNLIKHCDTRFASNFLMLQRYLALQIVVE